MVLWMGHLFLGSVFWSLSAEHLGGDIVCALANRINSLHRVKPRYKLFDTRCHVRLVDSQVDTVQ